MTYPATGTKFRVKNTEYVLDEVVPVDDSLKMVIDELVKNGKDQAIYFASKVLKSGNKSVQGGMFYRFEKSGNFVKV